MSKNFYKFSATWCGSCKIIQPKWKEIKNEYKNVFNFIDVDVDNDPDLVEKFGKLISEALNISLNDL